MEIICVLVDSGIDRVGALFVRVNIFHMSETSEEEKEVCQKLVSIHFKSYLNAILQRLPRVMAPPICKCSANLRYRQ